MDEKIQETDRRERTRMEEPCCHCHKTKQRTEGEYKKLMNRLNRNGRM